MLTDGAKLGDSDIVGTVLGSIDAEGDPDGTNDFDGFKLFDGAADDKFEGKEDGSSEGYCDLVGFEDGLWLELGC